MPTRIAIANWNGRVSPVFDSARSLDVVEIEDGKIVSRHGATFATDDPAAKVSALTGLGVSRLLCGAISRPLAELLGAHGIAVTPFVCGPVEEVLAAFLANRLSDPSLAMPGCCGRRRWAGTGGTAGLPHGPGHRCQHRQHGPRRNA